MPFCWLHTADLSSNGYAYPDGNGYTFIGFWGITVGLTDDHFTEDETYLKDAGYYFLKHFYCAALYLGYHHSINEALDYAVQNVWGSSFQDSFLYQGYILTDYDGTEYEGRMVVYGDGDIHISDHGGGGGGCPTLFVWDGSDYVDYGVIDIHNPTREDVVREVSIAKQDLAVEDLKANLCLQEGWLGLEYSHSEIDQVKLYAVDNHGNRLLCPLKKATYNNYNVRPILKQGDDEKLDIYLLETVDLEFLIPYQNVQGFTFIIEGCNLSKW